MKKHIICWTAYFKLKVEHISLIGRFLIEDAAKIHVLLLPIYPLTVWLLWLSQTCLVYAVGVENYTFEAQTEHLRLHYTNYANDFVSAMR